MSFAAVPKYGRMPVTIRSSNAANSGPRWLIICFAPASRTDGGRAVGPGMRRFGWKRVTGRTVSDGRGDGSGMPVDATRWSHTEPVRAAGAATGERCQRRRKRGRPEGQPRDGAQVTATISRRRA